MGVNTDAASVGYPYRPTPLSLANTLWAFDPRTAKPEEAPDIPESPDFKLVNWLVSTDSSTRLDFSDDFAIKFQRVWGYVASIDETKAENTDTGYRFEIVCRFPYRIRDFGNTDAEQSWIFARVRAYSSNCLLCDSAALTLGCIVTGVVTANYGGNGRAVLDAWSIVSDFSEWKEFSPDTILRPSDINFNEALVDWLPTVGGLPYAVHAPDENRILGIRMKPPHEDPHIFLRMRRAEKNADPNHEPPARHVRLSADTTYVRPRGRSASRPRNPRTP